MSINLFSLCANKFVPQSVRSQSAKMKSRHIFTLVVIALSSVSLVSSQGTCKDFAYDECKEVKDQTFESVHNITVEDCQFYCNTIYDGTCKYFYHDNKQKICLLLNTTGENLWTDCNKASGPKTPDVESCITHGSDYTPCWVRIIGYT